MTAEGNIVNSDKMVLRKPNIIDKKKEFSGGAKAKVVDDVKLKMTTKGNNVNKDKMVLRKPESIDKKKELPGGAKAKVVDDVKLKMVLRKPESIDKEKELSGGAKAKVVDDVKQKMNTKGNIVNNDKMMLRKPESIDKKKEFLSGAKDLVMNGIELKTGKEEAEVKRSNVTLLKKPQVVQTQPRLERKILQHRIPEVQVNDDVEQSGSRGTSESSGMKSAAKDEIDRLMSVLGNLLTKPAKKDRESDIGLKQVELEHSDAGSTEEEAASTEQSTTNFAYPAESYGSDVGVEAENSSEESPLEPDPLIDTLESVIGDDNHFDGRLQAAEADTEWADVDSLIKELQQLEGVQSASKGQFFLSPVLAPNFQVYIAPMFEGQYKLLAQAENKVQEIIVRASLDKDEMKSAIFIILFFRKKKRRNLQS